MTCQTHCGRGKMWRAAALLLVLACAWGCTAAPAAPPQREIVVLAAASLSDALEAAAVAYAAQQPDVRVTFNFAGSQQLAQQIVNGAPADIFAPANAAQMQAVVAAGRVAPADVQPLAQNRLAVVTPPDNPGGITALRDLATAGKKIVLADAAVPAGRYALEMLGQAAADPAYGAGFDRQVLANVVSYEESVRAVLTKVLLGEADAGVVYVSDVAAATAGATSPALQVVAIPAALNIIATYPIAVVADSQAAQHAAAFVDFLLAPAGQAILQDFGFEPVAASAGR